MSYTVFAIVFSKWQAFHGTEMDAIAK